MNFIQRKAYILIKISLKVIPKRSIDNMPALVEAMAYHPTGDKLLSGQMKAELTDEKNNFSDRYIAWCDAYLHVHISLRYHS